MPAPNVTKAAIQRAIEATKAAGLTPSAVTVSKDGTIRVETDPPESLEPASPPAPVLRPKQWATR